MMRRRGGLVRMAATTAVVAGTAGAVSHHQQQKYANQAAEQQAAAEAEQRAVLDVLGIERVNLLGEEDFEDIGSALDPNSTAALMIWENVWAAEFAKSLRNADGILVANGRIPAALVEEAMAASVS